MASTWRSGLDLITGGDQVTGRTVGIDRKRETPLSLRPLVAVAALTALLAAPLGTAAHAAPDGLDAEAVYDTLRLDRSSSRLVGRDLTLGSGSLQLDNGRLRIDMRTSEPGGYWGPKTHVYRVNGNRVDIPAVGESATVAVTGLHGVSQNQMGEARDFFEVILTNVDGTTFEVHEAGRHNTVAVLSTVQVGQIDTDVSTVGTILHGSQPADVSSGAIMRLGANEWTNETPLVVASTVHLPGWTDDYRLEVTALSFSLAGDGTVADVEVAGSLLVDEGVPTEYVLSGASGRYDTSTDRVTITVHADGGPHDSRLEFQLAP